MSNQPKSKKTGNLTTQLSFHVSGMHCASCAANIQRSLRKLDGVSQAGVNYANEQAVVQYDQTALSPDAIAQAVTNAGYTPQLNLSPEMLKAERTAELRVLKRKVLISGILSGLLLLSMVPGSPSWLQQPVVLWLLATPIQFWAGKQFYQGAWSALKNKTTTMDTLIALGTSVAYGFSVLVVLFGGLLAQHSIATHVYFETAGVVITLVLLGKYLELRAKEKTSSAIEKLFELQPATATLLTGKHGQIAKEVPISSVKQGDTVLVKAGQSIPVDGTILSGESAVDESMVTGESMPVAKGTGDSVIGGTLNQAGSLTITATSIGADSLLAQIIRSVQTAQGSKPAIASLADRVASYFVPAVLVIALLSGVAWFFFGPEPRLIASLITIVNVLVIACPCALGLATPTAIMVGVGKAAESGILIKDAQALEVASQIKAVIFDKTGTLTLGKPVVQQAWFAPKTNQAETLSLVAALEQHSNHPLAHSLLEFAFTRLPTDPQLPSVTQFSDVPGRGVRAKHQQHAVLLGSAAFVHSTLKHISAAAQTQIDQVTQAGHTATVLAIADQVVAVFGIADALRPDSAATVAQLQRQGIEPVMLTGDTAQTAQALAAKLGITQVFAEVLPQDKAARLKTLKETYSPLAMVGDGINDAPALAAADISIAMGSGTTAAIETAGITLLHGDIRLVLSVITISQATMRTIKQNLFWAFAYNIILIPVAMGVLYPFFGIVLNPMLAGAAMAFSSVSVVLNSLRLKGASL